MLTKLSGPAMNNARQGSAATIASNTNKTPCCGNGRLLGLRPYLAVKVLFFSIVHE